MNDPHTTPPAQGAATATSTGAAGQALQAWWKGLAVRERRMVAGAAAVLGAALLWSVAVAPALRTLNTAPARLDQLDAQLQTMQALAQEAAALRQLPPVNLAQSAEALKAASERLGDSAKLSVQGDRAVLTVSNLGTEALRAWLTEVRSGARARPVEANLSRGPQGYSGSIVLALGGGA
jgi:general secretion pathway protein M